MSEGQSAIRPEINDLTLTHIRRSLALGWADFRRAPLFGLFFAAVYVIGGLTFLLLGAGMMSWTLGMSLGFPLAAPFLAVGLYEVSRRLEAGMPLSWSAILGVVWSERNRQVPWLGAIIVIYFLFWTFLSHLIFALFMGPSALINMSSSWESYLTGPGATMIAVELVVGAVVAFLLFSLTVISLPFCLDQEVDFVTSMLTSLAVVRQNLTTMLLWAAIIAVLTFLAMVPAFLGIFLVLPWLGHASWHLYKQALRFEGGHQSKDE